MIALGLIGDERAVPSLIGALDAPKLRGWTIEALGRIGGSDAETALRHVRLPVWHRLHHVRRRQAFSRIAQRTSVGSPLVSALAERVSRCAAALLSAGVVIGLPVVLLGARLWPSIAITAAVTVVYAGWRMWRTPGIVATRIPSAATLPAGAPAPERWWRTSARQFAGAVLVLIIGLVVFGIIDVVAPVEVAAGIAAGLFRWPNYGREALRLARWQRREGRRLLHELVDDESDRYFLT